MSETAIRTQYWQKYFSKIKCAISMAYRFQGTIKVEKMSEAVETIYQHHQVLQYHVEDAHENPGENVHIKNSEEFQKTLDKQQKVVHVEIKDLREELTYLHNSAYEQIRYDNDKFLPIKLFVLTGYKDNEFCLCFIYDHQFLDEYGMTQQTNEIIDIYSKLVRGESTEDNIKLLQNRTNLDEQQLVEKHQQIPFWRCLINTIKTIRPKSGDPGKLQLDSKEYLKVFYEEYGEISKRENQKQFLIIDDFDYSEIFKGVHKTHPQIHKYYIILAVLYRFHDHYATNVRAKELGVDPETLRGPSASTYFFRNIEKEDYKQFSGNYLGQLQTLYDCRKYQSLEELALQIHNDIEQEKSNRIGVTNQVIGIAPLCNIDVVNAILNMNLKSSFQTSNWTNEGLLENPQMLEGGEYIGASKGYVHDHVPGTKYPNAFAIANLLQFNLTPKDIVNHGYSTMNYEQNVKVIEALKVYIKQQSQYYQEQSLTGNN